MIKHKVTYYKQPTNYSCSFAAVAMALSYYGDMIIPEEILSDIPVNKDDDGQDIGVINQDLATYCAKRGYKTAIHSADFQLLDMSWRNLSQKELRSKLDSIKDHRTDVPALGKKWTQEYIRSYADFMDAGGTLRVEQYMSAQLFDTLLKVGPFLPAVAPSVLYGEGRSRLIGLHQDVSDDINGQLSTHSIVVYGKNNDGQYLVADPWSGERIVKPEALVAAMQAAQVECDNLLITISK